MCLESHIEALRGKHAALEQKIKEAERHPSACSLEIKELKKEKLQLKDRIERFSRKLTPEDVHAAKVQLGIAASGGRRISKEVQLDLEVIANAA